MTLKKSEEITLKVQYRDIYIPPSQIRQDEPKVQEIAASLKEHGQYYPVLVTEGGPDGKKYTLNEGFRRCAAWVVNGWQDSKPIEIKIIAKKKPFDRIVTNWVANMEREGINYLDQCHTVGHLIEGTYAVLPGEKAVAIERYEIAQKLNITTGQVGRMYRVYKNLHPAVVSLARSVTDPVGPVPSSLLLEIAKIEKGEGEDAEKKDEDRARRQGTMLTEWIEKKKKLEAEGRIRSTRSDKGTTKKNGAAKNGKSAKNGKHVQEANIGVVAPERRVVHAVYKNEKDRSYSVEDYITVLTRKQQSLVKERNIVIKRPTELSYREQVIRLNGIRDGMRLLKGEITKLSDLTNEDFDVLNPPVAASAEAE